MLKTDAKRRIRAASMPAVMGAALLVGGALAGLAGSSVVQGQEVEALRIDVTLDEYSFSPDPLRIPAGRLVTLVIQNAGRVPHEFMAGRDVAGNDFGQDLFADLHVNIEPVEMADAGHEEHGGHAEETEHADQHDATEHGHEAAEADHHAGAEADAHGGGHAHGTMAEARVGETVLMTFTLPEDRRGEWMTGCFLPGHYDAGMHGTLIVE
jgi:uncharacterized cupredoxin-like copper-binding protein